MLRDIFLMRSHPSYPRSLSKKSGDGPVSINRAGTKSFPARNVLAESRCQLQQVMRGAEQAPFGSDFLLTTKQKLPKSSRGFDLTEDGLDNLLPQSISRSPARFAYSLSHLAYQTADVEVLVLASRSHVASNVSLLELPEISLRTVSGVGRNLLGLPPEIFFDLLQQWSHLVHV